MTAPERLEYRRCVVRGPRASTALLVTVLVLLASACARFEPRPLPSPPVAGVATSPERGGVTVAAAVLSDDQAAQHYGVDLASRGVQATWLRVRNASPSRYWFLIAAFDPDYYAPNEAAFLFHRGLGKRQEERLAAHFRAEAMPLLIAPGATVDGYLLAPRQEGGRYVNVELVGHADRLRFGFALPIENEGFDFEDVAPGALHADLPIPDLDASTLRERLRDLPCCAADAAGVAEGDPLNVVMVGSRSEVFAALARSGWSFTHRIDWRSIGRLLGAAIAGTPYPVAPVSPLHLFGRTQDVSLQRARTAIAQRNHMRLWLAPFRFEGRAVWVGQVSRDIGVKLTTKSPSLTTHVIDPQVDETREYLLQSLLVHHTVERFGFVRGVGATAPGAPGRNLTGDPYYTDGLRVVVVLARGLMPPEKARNLHWQEIDDPLHDAGTATTRNDERP